MPPLGLALTCSLLPFGFGFSVLLVLLLEWFSPDVIPFDLATFWIVDRPLWPSFTDACLLAGPIMLVGFAMTLVQIPRVRPFQRDLAIYGTDEGQVITLGPFTTVFRSTLEEIVFRWLLFFAAIAGAVFMDFLIFGFADVHPIRWIFTEALIPLADLATFGLLHGVLTEHPWTVAAAILTSNGRFRNGHSYQGIPGWIWSWYMGIALFVIMFEYGLPLAIAVHVAYNLVTVAIHLALVGTLPRIVLFP